MKTTTNAEFFYVRRTSVQPSIAIRQTTLPNFKKHRKGYNGYRKIWINVPKNPFSSKHFDIKQTFKKRAKTNDMKFK